MQNEQTREKDAQAEKLQELLNLHKDKRVIVVGTTCTGKSTFLERIKGSHDMDELVFPQLTQEEADYVNQTPWTPDIGQTMNKLVKEKVMVKPGEPVFGTILLDSDLIVYLKISDDLLRQRTAQRNALFEDAKNMQTQIEKEITSLNIPVIEFSVG